MFKKFSIISSISLISLSFISSFYSIPTSFYYPAKTSYYSSPFGYRNIFDSISFHNGIDFPLIEGTPIYSTTSGVVKSIDFSNVFGHYIIILNCDGSNSLYGHMAQESMVKLGDSVNYTTQIGNVGPKFLSNGKLNGMTTGPHLHFTIYNNNGVAINPLDFNLQKRE